MLLQRQLEVLTPGIAPVDRVKYTLVRTYEYIGMSPLSLSPLESDDQMIRRPESLQLEALCCARGGALVQPATEHPVQCAQVGGVRRRGSSPQRIRLAHITPSLHATSKQHRERRTPAERALVAWSGGCGAESRGRAARCVTVRDTSREA
eukprot:COSAG03_NODE_2294_length_2909_cov_3.235943_2_plen_150_part_00